MVCISFWVSLWRCVRPESIDAFTSCSPWRAYTCTMPVWLVIAWDVRDGAAVLLSTHREDIMNRSPFEPPPPSALCILLAATTRRKHAPLHAASTARCASGLIRLGADVEQRDDCDTTPLQHHCTFGSTDVAILLIDWGADVNCENTQGISILSVCSLWGLTGIARRLLEGGAQVDHVDEAGSDALMSAVFFDRPETVELLLQWGANPTKRNNLNRTAMQFAQQRGSRNALEVMLRL